MFQNMKIHFDYYNGIKKNSLIIDNNLKNNDFVCNISLKDEGNLKRLKVAIIPNKQISIDRLFISVEFPFKNTQRIFANGYQSWTDSREFFPDERIRSISKLAAPLMKKYQFDKYGDYTFKKYSEKPGEFHGYTYSYIRDGEVLNLIGSLTERNGYTIIDENIKSNEVIIEKDCKGLEISKEYTPFELVWIVGTEESVFDKYFELMDIDKPKCEPMTGWTSWYNYYQNINENIIIENLNNFKSMNKNIDIFQIDDGYQTAVGDWLSVDLSKFPKGMKYIADSIKKKGYKAGIWLAPFVCETNSLIYKEKKDWILKDDKGELVLAGSNWSRFYALDFYNEDVRNYIKNVFSVVLDEWGYDMVKLDFLYAVCLIPKKDKTRGTIMTEAMEFLRECIGDKLILGCGVPLGPAFGKVDYCRIGCDVSLDWDDKFFMKLLHRERVSTLNAIRNSIGRRQLNGRAFLNDPDVFLLRDDNITLTKTQKKTLSIVNHIFGSLLFTSDNIKKYDASNHIAFDNIMDLKLRKIENVSCYKNGITEIIYTEDMVKYLGIINLSDKEINYDNKITIVKEIFFDDNKERMIKDKLLNIEPYKIRIFEIAIEV